MSRDHMRGGLGTPLFLIRLSRSGVWRAESAPGGKNDMRKWRIRRRTALLGSVLSLCAVTGVAIAGISKAELQEALNDQAIVGDWNYDDIDGAFRRARKEGKPVCVVFR